MKEFNLSNKAIDNRKTIYIFTTLLIIFGVMQYFNTPKEKFPDVVFPYFMVTTINPGTSPVDMENLVTRPLEKEMKGINGIKHLTSQSLQDVSLVIVEFDVNKNEMEAYLDVRQAIDDATSELPVDLYQEPALTQIDVSEMPIVYINLSGDLGLVKLKEYAESMKDEIEAMSEISKVSIIGALEREIQIDVDLYKMQMAGLSFFSIENAIVTENMTISGGLIQIGAMKRNFRIVGEFQNIEEIGDILLKQGVFLKDIATITDGFKERESYSRLNGHDVISLSVVKKSGQNLIDAVDKVKTYLGQFEETASKNLIVKITGDSSTETRNSVTNLFNTIILGFIIVVFILMFFMGELDAVFVGVAIPLSMIIAFAVLPMIGFTMNMIVLFAFIMVLGIVVDNSIVIVENIYRHFTTGKDITIERATKEAVGEVAIPVLTGTLTTIAPFFPLIFMPGIMGQFISYLPITLIITLVGSIIVAYFMNPVFAVSFMKRESKEKVKHHSLTKKFWKNGSILLAVAILFYIIDWMLLANIIVFGLLIYIFLKTVMLDLIDRFQAKTLPAFMAIYRRFLAYWLFGKRPFIIVGFTVALFFTALALTVFTPPKIVFMPAGEPNNLHTYIKMPEGTHIAVTDSITKEVERRIFEILGENNPDVESVIANVAANAGNGDFDRITQEKLGKVTVSFVEYKFRTGERSTLDYMDEIRDKVQGIPGAQIEVDRDAMGPPAGKPISIEVSGEDLSMLVDISENLKQHIVAEKIAGIEELKTNMEVSKPELLLKIDRVKAAELGISTAQIGMKMRTALYGSEISKLREGEDEYPIQLRLSADTRHDIEFLLNQEIHVAGRNGNPPSDIPISAVASVDLTSTYGSIIRKDNKRVITLSSNILTGYNANEILAEINSIMPSFDLPSGYAISFTGEQDMQNEIGAFMIKALFIAIALIIIILVGQFNSIAKPAIITSQILFSIIGVLMGFITFQIDISIMMTGMGIIAVAGIVVKNAIILIDYIDEQMKNATDKVDAIVTAGATRLTPVLLTALSTVLGLAPLAIGININFITLFTELDPQIYFGGDTVSFWNPLAWTIIFGLSFATFLTLIVVPAMYKIVYVREK